jgi:hypothetical protein
VVATFRNRDPKSLLNLQRTLAAQTRLPDALAVINFGEPCAELERPDLPFRYLYRRVPQGPEWNTALAMNQGARLLPPVQTVLFLDSDMLLAPNFIQCGLGLLKKGVLLNCQILNLPEGAVTAETDVVGDFERLKSLTTPRTEMIALGACQWLRMEAFLALRGRDEAFQMGFFEDMDFQRRARWLGLRPVHLEEETSFLHQWHRPKDTVYRDPKDPEHQAFRHWYPKNLGRYRGRGLLWDVGRIHPWDVNPAGWGKMD